jgi:hypothetical protein
MCSAYINYYSDISDQFEVRYYSYPRYQVGILIIFDGVFVCCG